LRPRICVSIAEAKTRRVVEALGEVDESEVDLVEIRLDYLSSKNELSEIRKATDLPLIATNRRRDEGGLCQVDDEKRLETLVRAVNDGFEYVDLELLTTAIQEPVENLKEKDAKVIVSFHDLHRTPSLRVLERVLREERETGADVCKIVGTVGGVEDNLTYLDLLVRNRGQCKVVCFGMGDEGRLSRVVSPLCGAEFTYASLREGREAAPGQITVEGMRQIYKLMGLST
jgi:3-dehydroquinate dehydratase-1